MAKSLAAQIAELEREIEVQMAGETEIRIQFIICSTRAEVLALERYEAEHPEPPRPPAPGRIRLVQLPTITGGEILRQHGVPWPPETENTLEEEQNQ